MRWLVWSLVRRREMPAQEAIRKAPWLHADRRRKFRRFHYRRHSITLLALSLKYLYPKCVWHHVQHVPSSFVGNNFHFFRGTYCALVHILFSSFYKQLKTTRGNRLTRGEKSSHTSFVSSFFSALNGAASYWKVFNCEKIFLFETVQCVL